MKYFVTIGILLSLMHVCNGQGMIPNSATPIYNSLYYTFEDNILDTIYLDSLPVIIDGKEWYNVYEAAYIANTSARVPGYPKLIGRQRKTGSRVLYKVLHSLEEFNREGILYDYGLNEGDTLTMLAPETYLFRSSGSERYLVDSIRYASCFQRDSVKLFYLQAQDTTFADGPAPFYYVLWFEDIGAKHHPYPASICHPWYFSPNCEQIFLSNERFIDNRWVDVLNETCEILSTSATTLAPASGATFLLSPNPIAPDQKIYLQFSEPQIVKQINIFNATGRKVYQMAAATNPVSKITLDYVQLTAGIHYVVVTLVDGSVASKKLIVR